MHKSFSQSLWVSKAWNCWISKLDVLGAHLSGSSFKSQECLMWGSNPLLLRNKLRVLNSLPTVCCHAKIQVYGMMCPRVSHKLPFLQYLVVHLVLGYFFFFEQVVPYLSVDSVCSWAQLSSLVAILNQNPSPHFRFVLYLLFFNLWESHWLITL